MSLLRNCTCTQKGACQRRSQGIGGVRRSLYNKMVHIPKNTGEKLLSTSEAEATLRTVRNSAIDAGMNMVTDKLSSKKSARKHLTPAGKAEFAAAAAAAAPSRRKRATAAAVTADGGGGKAKRGAVRDVFDDDDHTLEDMQE